MATRLLAGETRGVSSELDERSVRTVRGKKWSRAGLVAGADPAAQRWPHNYRGKVVAKLPGEHVLSEDEHEQLSLYQARRPGRRRPALACVPAWSPAGRAASRYSGKAGLTDATRTARSAAVPVQPDRRLWGAARPRSTSVPWTNAEELAIAVLSDAEVQAGRRWLG